jgi:hypothetical protein
MPIDFTFLPGLRPSKTGIMEKPKLLFRANEGALIKQYADIHAWANIIFQAVRNE